MFQSGGNLFSNTSNLLNIHHLRKILKIPQDQLNLLNNIPGWSSCSKASFEKPVVLQSEGKSKDSSELQFSSTSQKTDLINSKKSEILRNISVCEKKTLFFKNKPSSLVRSASLNSLNKTELLSSYSIIKRSSSYPNMNENISCINSSNSGDQSSEAVSTRNRDRFKAFSLSSSQNGVESRIITSDLHSVKSHFSDSAVQCKMSQSSQPNFEMALSERIAPASAPSDCRKNCNDKHPVAPDDQWKRKSITYSDIIKYSNVASTKGVTEMEVSTKMSDQNIEQPVDKLNSLSRKKQGSLKETSRVNITDTDESFVSQPISCAQPLSRENPLVQKEDLIIIVQKNVPTILPVAVSNTSIKPIQSSLEKKGHLSVGKRKRKNKQEKIPKKFRGVNINDIEILYSSEQIKNMVEVIKVLNH